jgi:DNA-binding MarR family transcriptional regulator
LNDTRDAPTIARSFTDRIVQYRYCLAVTSASNRQRKDGVAFLLAQLGQHAAAMFAERIAPLGLTPPHAGILRAIAANPGQSQQALSGHLGLLPSRVVAYVDELEDRGFVERRRNPGDRRLHALHLTKAGEELMGSLSEVFKQHDRAITAGLTSAERAALQDLLATLAGHRGLTPGVHPGFRALGRGGRAPTMER